jgi:hypothetical protein
MAKYKVIGGKFTFNGNQLMVGQVFDGENKGAKFLNDPAITINYLGKSVNVPSKYLQKVGDSTSTTSQQAINVENVKTSRIKSISKLAGLGAGLYIAHKMKKGTWGYIGFGVLGLFLGAVVGSNFSKTVK